MADYKKGPFGSALKKSIFVPKDDSTVKVYEQQNAINKDWKLERYFITKEYAEKLKGFKVSAGDIIVSCAGTIGEIYELPMDAESGIINQALMRIRVHEDRINKKMFIILFTNMIDEFTRVHSNGSAIKNIPPFSDLKPMKVLVPTFDEQNKIAHYFYELDNLITLHQRKCEETKKLKKYMLQKMFPQNGKRVPEIRFAGFTDDWEQRKFGNVTELKSASRVHKEEWTTSGVPFYRSSDVMAAINGTENEKAYISEALYEKLSSISGKLEAGDVLVTGGGSVGKPYIVPNNEPLYTKDADLLWIKNQGKFHPYFLYEFFFTPTFRSYLSSISHVGTIAHYTITQLSETPICLPSVGEQQKIGDYFYNIDHLITLHQRKYEELQKIKKFMLQNMFI